MDEFAIFIFCSLLALFLVFYALGKWYPGTGAEQVDWHPTRSPELEAQLEMEDLEQMLEAQNVRRRKRGEPELTEDQVQAEVDEAERWRADLAERYRRESEQDIES